MPADRPKRSSKQTKLSFASAKRTNSTSDKSAKKKTKAAPAKETKQERNNSSEEPIEIITVPDEVPAAREELKVKDPRWKGVLKEANEQMGYLPPIHGEGKNNIHHILRVFDMNYTYGPCSGISRIDRWNRAEANGLNPPVEIRDILMTRQGIEKTEYSQSCLYGGLL